MKKAAKILLIVECALLVLCALIFVFLGILSMSATGAEGAAVLGTASFIYAFVILIPLAWNIPFIKKINDADECGQELSAGFKVCVLLLCGWIPGILLLLDNA